MLQRAWLIGMGRGQGSRKLGPMLVSERSQKLAQGWLVSSTTLGEVKASLFRVLVGFRT